MNGGPHAALYRTVWRWHFYAGLFVMPMVLLLALSGAAFLFKPQIDRWEEARLTGAAFALAGIAPAASPATPDAQVAAALAAFPGAVFTSYRIGAAQGDAAVVQVAGPGGVALRDVFVSPQGDVLGSLAPEARMTAVIQRLHGQLLIGRQGSWIVELAASWAIAMILSGLYLWWPAGRGLAGVVWPRLRAGSRVFWRDLHAVTGFWVAGLALVLLLTGLPWADAWGSAFKAVRAELGWVRGQQDWTIGGRAAAVDEHAGHDQAAPVKAHQMPDGSMMTTAMTAVSLGRIVAEAKSERLPFPVIVTPPGAGRKATKVWTVRSDTQNRPLRVTITYDPMTGRLLTRETFADKHVIDRVIGYGVAWHEGQLLGAVNQVVGVATALMLVTLSVSGFVMWRRRKPVDGLGAPPASAAKARLGGLAVIVPGLAVFLPLLGLSLAGVWLVERLVLARVPPVARWLGLRTG